MDTIPTLGADRAL